MLDLPLVGSIEDFNIANYYKDPRQREELSRRLELAEQQGEKLEKQNTVFVLHGRERLVELYCRTVRSEGEVIGFNGCIIDITDDDRVREFLDLLPVGTYQMDATGLLTSVNFALVKFLGFLSREEVQGKPFSQFLVDPSSLQQVTRLTADNRPIESQLLEMKRKTDERFFASVSSMPVLDPSGLNRGFKGTIEDVTLREQYRSILEKLPLGIYMVHVMDGRDIIVHCNDQFAKIFDYKRASEVIGLDIRDLHQELKAYDDFIQRAVEAHSRGQDLLGHWLSTKLHSGRQVTLEVNCRISLDSEAKAMIERIGILRDVSDEAELRRKVHTFTADIGAVLHMYSSHLVMLKTALEPTALSLSRDQSDERSFATEEELLKAIDGAAMALMSALAKFIDLLEGERAGLVKKANLASLQDCAELLRTYRTGIALEPLRAPTLRDTAQEVLSVLDQLPRHQLPKEQYRSVKAEAWRLERLCCLNAVRHVLEAVSEMDYQVRAFRDYVSREVRPREVRVARSTGDLISQVITNLAEFARLRRVNIRPRKDMAIIVSVVERDVVRALSNLLHNAIKYSWARSSGEPAWVGIRVDLEQQPAKAGRPPGTRVQIKIENYGVAIPKEEIDSGFIYQVGTRGRLAGDRRRTGTGIGLSDAVGVARRHGGDVFIESRPATPGLDEHDYTKPFITTATFTLPVGVTERG